MLGLMQDWPLLQHKIIDHAALQYGDQEIVTRSVEGPIHRTNYREVRGRALRVAQRLGMDGVKLGDRVATLAWNTWRHLEAWYGITGVGAVYHTVNPRLFPEQIAWIVNHAQDRAMMLDLTFVPLMEAVQDKCPSIERYIILTDKAHMPATKLKNAVAYEEWLAEADGNFKWAEFDENTAAGLCYTSGTTGDPKGVLYSHRSNVLHALQACMKDTLSVSAQDSILPIVPMFHANAWSLAFSVPLAGAKFVMPGAKLDGASVYELLEAEKVTFSAAVPTVWLMLMQHMQANKVELHTLQRVAIGGSACPPSMIEFFEARGVTVYHAWGMTEMSPIGTIGAIKPALGGLGGKDLLAIKSKQGHAIFAVEMKITDDEGNQLPWDGVKFGRLKVKGPAIARRYFRREDEEILDDEGFFDTGDVATIDPNGYMQITDRAKDVIKSGGEWISSIDLENIAVGHPDVAEAAVIGVVHPKWDERPLLVIVPKEGKQVDRDAMLKYMDGKIAKWWMPDDVQFVREIPHTATGKINKLKLREEFKEYKLPSA
ncbi:MAG: long-chain-fatty-acid--CoA ligase [Methylobacteriaceae bacterium]|nr:long-chain-fatty-acid--CoA ligase [Methylobacteriaceae bacterium]